MVYSRETAAVIAIVANAQFSRLTCFVEKQGNASIQLGTRAEKGPGRAGNRLWLKDTALGNAVADVADSE